MEIEELRLGNLVLINDKIITVDRRIFHAILNEFTGYNPETIQITEEWLNKFKFKELGFESLSVAFGITKHDVRFVMGNYYKGIKFVHELQNLYFALTGTELQLK